MKIKLWLANKQTPQWEKDLRQGKGKNVLSLIKEEEK